MVLEITPATFVLARNHVLTNAIVSQEDTTECREKVSTLQPTSVHRKAHKICQQVRSTDLLICLLQVKTRSVGGTKYSSPRRRDQMIRAIHCRQVAKHLNLSNLSQHILPYNEPDLYNDFLTNEVDYKDHYTINFPRHCVLGHVLLDSDLLDDLGPWQEVVQPTKKPRSVGPHKSKPKKTTSMKKTRQKDKKSRSVTIQIPEKTRSVKVEVP